MVSIRIAYSEFLSLEMGLENGGRGWALNIDTKDLHE
jgi:hypothetical protein